MPFGLRNAGAMYQQCMQHVFRKHIGPTVKAYVDDIVVKSKRDNNLVDDLDIVFKCLKEKTSSSIPRNVSSVFLEACS
jgi:hypothetical protein